MAHVSLWVRCVFAAALVLTMVLAFWGRPPRRRPRMGTWRGLAGVGAAFYLAGCAALLLDEAVISAALVGIGVEALSVVAWLGRALGDDDGGGGGDNDGDDPDSGDRGDGDGPPEGWLFDERAFWDYVARRERDRPREPSLR
jgi:hypothetical protein